MVGFTVRKWKIDDICPLRSFCFPGSYCRGLGILWRKLQMYEGDGMWGWTVWNQSSVLVPRTLVKHLPPFPLASDKIRHPGCPALDCPEWWHLTKMVEGLRVTSDQWKPGVFASCRLHHLIHSLIYSFNLYLPILSRMLLVSVYIFWASPLGCTSTSFICWCLYRFYLWDFSKVTLPSLADRWRDKVWRFLRRSLPMTEFTYKCLGTVPRGVNNTQAPFLHHFPVFPWHWIPAAHNLSLSDDTPFRRLPSFPCVPPQPFLTVFCTSLPDEPPPLESLSQSPLYTYYIPGAVAGLHGLDNHQIIRFQTPMTGWWGDVW